MVSVPFTSSFLSQSELALTVDWIHLWKAGQLSDLELEAKLIPLLRTSTGAKGFFFGYLIAFHPLPQPAVDVVVRVIKLSASSSIPCFLKQIALSSLRALHYKDQGEIELFYEHEWLKKQSILFLHSLQLTEVTTEVDKFLMTLKTRQGQYQAFIERWNCNQQQCQAIAQTLLFVNPLQSVDAVDLVETPVHLLKFKPKRWQIKQEERPWLELENADQKLQEKYTNQEITPAQLQWLKQWQKEGYFIVDNLIDTALIDRMNQELEALWYAETPIPDALFHNLGFNHKETQTYSHADLLQLDVETRETLRDQSRWRIHGVQKFSTAAKQIFYHPNLQEISRLIFAKPAQPQFSISFRRGSEQALHEDMAVFHILPLNHLVGVWIAAEDISPDSGPLVYYPGSHQTTLYEAFDNYPQTNLRTLPPQRMQDYYDYVEQRVKDRYPRKQFIAKKGQVLFWHGMLVHGGSLANDPSLTRKSLVLHFVAAGANRDGEVHGPFNW